MKRTKEPIGSVPTIDKLGEDYITILLTPHKSDFLASSALIQSLLENRGESKIDIVIFYENIDKRLIQQLQASFEEDENFSIRTIDIKAFIDKLYCFKHVINRNIRTTFFRLLAPYYLCNYDKVLYIDPDAIVDGDISEIWETNVKDVCVAAVQDLVSSWELQAGDSLAEYRENVLGIRPIDYVNAGVLLLNLHKIREHYTFDKMTELMEKNWKSKDQDIINHICGKYGRVLLPYRYNYIHFMQEEERNRLISKENKQIIEEAGRKPLIIHYAGPVKPWNNLKAAYVETFWKYAKKVCFYGNLLNQVGMDRAFEMTRDLAKDGKIGIYKSLLVLKESCLYRIVHFWR